MLQNYYYFTLKPPSVQLIFCHRYFNFLHTFYLLFFPECGSILGVDQCDHIGPFIGLWATFQSLWPQLFCQNLLHSYAIFVKVTKVLFLW